MAYFTDDEDQDSNIPLAEEMPSSLEDLSTDEPVESDNLESEVQQVEPTENVELTADMPLVSPNSKYEDLISQYRDLQDQRRKNNMMLGVLAGGQILGQGLVGKHSGQFDTDLSNIKMLQGMNDQKVQDYSDAIKQDGLDISLGDMKQMRAADSPVSEFYRTMAIKRGFNPQDVEGKSAWDLAQMQKLIGKPSNEGRAFQQVRLRNPETGVIETRLVNMVTGEVGPSVGEAGFAQQVRSNPRTGEIISVNPASGRQTGSLTAPSSQQLEQAEQKTPVITRDQLTVNQQKQLDNSRKAFIDDTKDTRSALEASKNISALIKSGDVIGADFVRAIQTQIARANGEKGTMTENDVAGFGGSPAILDTLKRWGSVKAFGKLPQEDKDRLIGLAKVMQQRAENYMQQRTNFFANNLYQDLKSAPNMQNTKMNVRSMESLLGSDVYTNPNFNKVQVIETKSGKRGFISQDKIEDALKATNSDGTPKFQLVK